MTNIPTLETERLILRAQTMNDWPDYLAMMRSERSHFMGGPLTEDYTWGVFCHDVASWALFGHGALMMEDKISGQCLGQIGLNAGPLFPEPELGWFVYTSAEGKGFAFEGAQCLRDWVFKNLKFDSFVSYMDPKNERSIKLAQKLGGQLDETAIRTDPLDLVYRYLRV